MKNKTYFGREHLFRWLLLFWLAIPWAIHAQTGTHITSNFQVGCKDYRGDKEDEFENNVSVETIAPSQCVKVCEGSGVTYTAHGQNISNVQWSASGGTVGTVSGPGNTEAVVNWGAVGSGSVQALITYSNGTIETQTVCIEKINSPIAEFSMMNLDRTVCRNTLILFENTSSNNGGAEIVNYFWNFGDGSPNETSTAFEPSHAFTQAGNYEVTLTVTNKCGCSNTFTLPVEVLESPPVQINCASVVCEGSIEKYSVQDGCKDGEWEVIGGNIVANNGNEIEVRWDQVDPADGFGYVKYRSQCGCREWTTIKIPVILSSGEIQGPSTVCANTQYKYSLPQWPTTNFQWNMSSGGQLIYNQQRNEVIFQASQPGTYTLWCTYLNTLLQCEGYAEMTITVEAPVTISGGSPEICVGTSQTFTATPNVPVIWTVTSGSSVVHTSSPTTLPFTYPFATAGFYMVTATKQGGGCESNGIPVKVIPPPAAPTGTILGEDLICTGKPYVYSLSPLNSGTIPVWEVTNGTIQGSNTGTSVTVVFNAGAPSYSVSVRNRSLDTAGCLSSPITKSVSLINLDTITPNLNPGPFCPSSSQNFSVNLNGIVPDSMEWSFADANFGSFAGGQGTSDISVNFNEISNNISSTTLNLKIVKCGIEKTIQFPVSLLTLPVVSFVNNIPICLGSNLQFTVNQGTITSAAQVTFTFENGTQYTTTVFNSSGTYNFPNNGYIQNNSGANVSQTVTVSYTDTNGCNYNPTASAVFTVYPETIITVSPVYNLIVCDPLSMTPYTLTANSSTGLTNTTDWQWIRNGIEIPSATTNSYTLFGAGVFGTYRVRATDQNGCTVYSQEITVTQDCPASGCTADPQIVFTPSWTSCNTINVSNVSYLGTPDEIQWGSSSVLTLVSGQGSNSPVYQSNLAGAHIVILRLRFGSCWYSAGYEVQKKYEPKFNISTVCSGNGYNLTLHNTSTIFNINTPISYSFSSQGQPVQNGQTATYNNLAPGTYTFTMTMSAPGFPPCTTTQTITLAPVPSVNFTSPDEACLGEIITLSVPGIYVPTNTYTWSFDGTSYVTSASTAQITFNTSGPRDIQLKVKTINGCEYISGLMPIYINLKNTAGTYDFYNPIGCVGSGPTIFFNPASGEVVTGYSWMNGSNPVVGAPNSSSFTPTQSGNYWPVLISDKGCKSYAMSTNQASVTLQNTPYVNISAKSNICSGQSVTLTGIVTDNNLEYRWGDNAPPTGAWQTTPFPISYTAQNLAAGTYTYYLEVRPVGTTTGCVGSKSFTVTVSNPPPTPVITYSQQGCQPYKVLLTASGPSTGDYNWSNGMTGQSIEVYEGGAYQVTYTAPSGCKVSSQVQIPLSIESLIWVFPTGCYDECRGDRYIIGPTGIFDNHEWQMFGNNMQSGSNSFIYPYFMNDAGTFNLQIEQFGCTYTSGPLNFYPSVDCGIEPECKFEVAVEGMRWDVDHYILQGVINNFGGQPITITISSLNGYGSYIPSIITIPAGGTYDMFTNPVSFYPNPNYPGGADEILFNAGNGCEVVTKVEIPNYVTRGNDLKSVAPEAGITASSIKIFPNPAKEKVRISYSTGNEKLKAKQLKVFDAMGNIKFSKELKTASGDVDIDVSGWLQSMYIVIIHTDGKPLQGKLLKN